VIREVKTHPAWSQSIQNKGNCFTALADDFGIERRFIHELVLMH
jgi:hypothetical protein